MSYRTIASFLLMIASPVACPASAQGVDMSHHTSSDKPVTLADWSQRMELELERQMVYPLGPDREPINGSVRVKFNCSESGRPDKVALLKGSGNAAVDRAAMRAVKKMASLHPLPSGFTKATPYEAIVLFATDARDRRITDNDAEVLKRNAWYRPGTANAVTSRTSVASR